MILRSVQQFWIKLLRIEVKQFTRNVFVMVVQEQFRRNIMQKIVQAVDNANSVMVDILQYYMGLKLRKRNQREEPMK